MTRTRLLWAAGGLLLAGSLASAPAAAEFDCYKTAVCQRQANQKKQEKPAPTPAPEKAARAFVPSKTAVQMRLKQTPAPAQRDEKRVSAEPRCTTKPAVCFRQTKR